MGTKDGDGLGWPVWNTQDVAQFLTRTLKKRRRPVSPGTVRRWAKEQKLPAQWWYRGRKGVWWFEPEEIRDWALGRFGGKVKFQLAYYPRAALQQVRDLLRDICDPEHVSEGWKFETSQQGNLCTAISKILGSSHYASIWPMVRHLAKTYRGNPALACLEDIGGLFD